METGSLSRLWHLVAAVAIALAILPLGIVPDAQAATGPYVFSCKTKGVGYTLKKQPKKFIIDCYRLDVRARKLTWVAPNRATGVLVVEEPGYQKVTHERRAVFKFSAASAMTATETAYKKLRIKYQKPLDGSKKSTWTLMQTFQFTPCIYTWARGPLDKLCHDAPR